MLEEKTSTLTTSNAKLAAKVLDLESRSRRNNIRVIGLPETIEGTQPTAFFSNMLGEVFGDVLGSPPECERAHRSLAPKPAPHQRPRPVIIRLLKFQHKDRIIREARLKRGQLKFQNHSILIFEDYPPEVVELRREYREVMSELYKLNLKPALLFPARLTIHCPKSGGRKNVSSVTEAKNLIASHKHD